MVMLPRYSGAAGRRLCPAGIFGEPHRIHKFI